MNSPAILRQEHVDGARLFADRNELIKSLSYLQNPTVAELGVAYGDFSRFVIDHLRPRYFHAYDVFRTHEHPIIWGKPTADIFKGLTHRTFFDKRFEKEIAVGQMEVFEGDGATNLNDRNDEFYDIIYIDAGHTYDSVLKDAMVSIRKLKRDGFLIFNDYIIFDYIANMHYGIVHVVNDLCVNQGWKITHFAFQNLMFCDVAIQQSR
jgi:hypothetical protein